MPSTERARLGDLAEVDGRLARVISINEGNREIGFEFVRSEPCPTCGRPDRIHINEGCLNWFSQVRPVRALPHPASPRSHELGAGIASEGGSANPREVATDAPASPPTEGAQDAD